MAFIPVESDKSSFNVSARPTPVLVIDAAIMASVLVAAGYVGSVSVQPVAVFVMTAVP